MLTLNTKTSSIFFQGPFDDTPRLLVQCTSLVTAQCFYTWAMLESQARNRGFESLEAEIEASAKFLGDILALSKESQDPKLRALLEEHFRGRSPRST